MNNNYAMSAKTVLYVEDDDNDALFMRKAFEKAGITNPLRIVHDGQEAIDFLAGNREFVDRQQYPLPCLVLLDLNLPKKSGLEVLRWIREQPGFFTLIVVIMSASNQEMDIHRAYSLGANAYLVKPPSAVELLDMAQTIYKFWLGHNQTPPACLQFKGNNLISAQHLHQDAARTY
jgi:CheY-like chemotaxis protein